MRRRPEIDAVRGVAVVMVVGAHVVLGLVDAGSLPHDSALYAAYDVTHVFRVATIAFVAGLFIPTSLARHGARRLLRDRAVLFGWLYVVWWSIQTVVGLATNPLRNTPTPLGPETLAIWTPPAQLYFFPALWVGTALTVGLLCAADWAARTGHRFASLPVELTSLAVLAWATWGWVPPVMGLQYLALALFVGTGAALGVDRVRSLLERTPAAVWFAVTGLSAAVFCLGQPLGIVGPTDSSSLPWGVRAASIVATGAGVSTLFAAVVLLCRIRPIRRVAAWIGQRTVVVFTAHIVFAAGARIVLGLVDAPVVVALVVAWAAGVVGPLVLAAVAPRIGLAWLFAPPHRRGRRGRGDPVENPAEKPVKMH